MAEPGEHGVLRLRATWWRRIAGDGSMMYSLSLIGFGVAGTVGGLAGGSLIGWPLVSVFVLIVPGVLLLLWLMTGEVIIDAEGITVEHFHRRRRLPWAEIRSIAFQDRNGVCPVIERTHVRSVDAPLYVVHRSGLVLSPLCAVGRDYRARLYAPLIAAARAHGYDVRVPRWATAAQLSEAEN